MSTAAYASGIDESTLKSVAMGSGRDEVHEKIGDPDAVSGNGSKEVYEISETKTAVLQYKGETLSVGYIINGR